MASLFVAVAVVAAASAGLAQSTGCWRGADCRDAPASAAPSADFRYGSGKPPETDFRSLTGEPLGAGPLRLDGEPVAEAERRLLRPENMRFRQYTAPAWQQSAGGSTWQQPGGGPSWQQPGGGPSWQQPGGGPSWQQPFGGANGMPEQPAKAYGQ